jgi:hypothetical protein
MRTLVAIVSLLFASLSFAAAPQSGLWWSPSESGRGYALDAQGNTLVVTTFAYGPDGRMQWYYSDGPLLAGGASWTGTLLRLDNGQPLAGNYVPATIVGNAGTITINFSTRTTGTLTLPGGRQVAIQRQNFGVGTAPSSLLGIWIYTHCTSTTTAVCFMERYSYSTIGQATSTGSGVVVDGVRSGAAELQVSGPLAGQVVAFRFDAVGNVLDQYRYVQYLEEGRGNWVGSSSLFQMFAHRIANASGIEKLHEGENPDASSLGGKSRTEQKAIPLEELARADPEVGRIAREMWGAFSARVLADAAPR